MLLILTALFLCAFSSSGSFPKPFKKEEEERYLLWLHDEAENVREYAKQQLIHHNLRLVAHIAKKYHNLYRDQEELISIGIIGLIKAILSYDNEKSIRLATYASRCIENEILMSLRTAKKYQNDISLHEPIGTDRDGNEIIMLDVVYSDTPDFADQLELQIQSEKMLHAVRESLTEKERLVIVLRYGLWNEEPQTQQAIASILGISRSYVSRIEKKALKKLNTALNE